MFKLQQAPDGWLYSCQGGRHAQAVRGCTATGGLMNPMLLRASRSWARFMHGLRVLMYCQDPARAQHAPEP